MKVFDSLSDVRAVDQLRLGAIGVIPTDTVYGLVARAQDAAAVQALYAAKPRERQPGTIVAANIHQLHELGFAYHDLHVADRYWPDALSVVLEAAQVPPYLKADLPDLAVRIPNHHDLLTLLQQTGPLMTTSANLPSHPTATTIAEAFGYFGDTIDFYVDGGAIKNHQPSTIVRIDNGSLIVLRQGAVTISPSS